MNVEMLLRQAALYREDARHSVSLFGDRRTAKIYTNRAELCEKRAARMNKKASK